MSEKRLVNKQHISLNLARYISRAIVNLCAAYPPESGAERRNGGRRLSKHPGCAGARPPFSTVCLPIIKQTELIGLLYLENRLSAGVFTAEKTDMTELFTAQAAISLENARLLEETRRAYLRLQENQEHMLQMEKLSVLGTLAGGVAQEINNPLMGVMNFVEFVAERTEDAKSKEILNQAPQQVHRIKKIVINMLVFVRRKATQTGNCLVPEVIRQSLLLLKGELHKTGIRVEVDAAGGLPEIHCSADSLLQIPVNLIINARDALADSRQPVIKIVARPIEGMLELKVTDNGPGIPQEIQANIFDPFFTTV